MRFTRIVTVKYFAPQEKFVDQRYRFIKVNYTMNNCQEKELEMINGSQEATDETERKECSDQLAYCNLGEIWTLNWRDVDSKTRMLSSQLFPLNYLVYEFLYGEKDWNCLIEELTMFQDNVHLWISDEQTNDRLNVAIHIVKDAFLHLLTKRDLLVYDQFSRIMQQVNVLMDFFQTAEQPQPCQREIMRCIKLAWEIPDPNQSCFEEYVLPHDVIDRSVNQLPTDCCNFQEFRNSYDSPVSLDFPNQDPIVTSC